MASTTFSYTGSSQTFTVPDGVSSVTIECWGAAGGNNGGAGGYAKGELVVSPAEVLNIYVGGQGGDQMGGWNGGGDAGNSENRDTGTGGGGGTDVRYGGSTTSDRIIVAGGGGGSGTTGASYSTGGADGGGTQGNDAADNSPFSGTIGGGDGGTQTQGGAGGSGEFDGDPDGLPGSFHQGGNSADSDLYTGGGGGGGYYGGGGGAGGNGGGGGGGGSGYVGGVTNTSMSTGVRSGDGQIVLSWVVAPATPNNVSATVDADDQITLSWETDTTGGDPADFDVEIDRDGSGFVAPSGGPSNISADGSGSYSVTYSPHSSAGSSKDYNGTIGADSSFQFRVRGNNEGGTSGWASSSAVNTTPIPPHNPSINRPNSTDATFQFTTRSAIASSTELEYRQDTGSGYGAWTTSASSPVTSGDTITLDADSRYQFRLRTVGPDGKVSDWVYTDYGNRNNVYFEDDFASGDASAWDATSGSATVTDTLDSVYTAGDSTQTPETGGFAVQMGGAGYVEKSLGDLSGQSNVHVRVTVQTASNDAASERGDLWWYDGSTWQTLQQWGWELDGQGWMEYHAVVPASYLAADNRVRVGRDEGGGVDYVAFDRVIVSDILHEYTEPAAPTGLTLEATAEGEITYSFADNMAIQEASRPFGDLYLDGTLQSKNGGTSGTITGLVDGEEFMVEPRVAPIQARYGSTDKFWNNTGATSTIVTILPAPTNLVVDSVTIDSATISWTDNHDYGDTRVEFKQSDAASWTTFSTLARNTGAETITNLLHGELYDTRVVAQTEHTTTEDQ